MHQLFVFCFFKSSILTEKLELTCPIYLFSSYPLILLLHVTYFEQNGSFYMEEKVILNRKIHWASQKEGLTLGQKLIKHFFKFYIPLQVYKPS